MIDHAPPVAFHIGTCIGDPGSFPIFEVGQILKAKGVMGEVYLGHHRLRF
jgi:hypothetical protein